MTEEEMTVVQRSLVAIKTLLDNGRAELGSVEKGYAVDMVNGLMEYIDHINDKTDTDKEVLIDPKQPAEYWNPDDEMATREDGPLVSTLLKSGAQTSKES